MLNKYVDFLVWLVVSVLLTAGAMAVNHGAMYMVWLIGLVLITGVSFHNFTVKAKELSAAQLEIRKVVKEEVERARLASRGY